MDNIRGFYVYTTNNDIVGFISLNSENKGIFSRIENGVFPDIQYLEKFYDGKLENLLTIPEIIDKYFLFETNILDQSIVAPLVKTEVAEEVESREVEPVSPVSDVEVEKEEPISEEEKKVEPVSDVEEEPISTEEEKVEPVVQDKSDVAPIVADITEETKKGNNENSIKLLQTIITKITDSLMNK